MNLQNLPVSKVLEMIAKYQGIQRVNPPSSSAWLMASENLQPLFSEMARRQEKKGAASNV